MVLFTWDVTDNVADSVKLCVQDSGNMFTDLNLTDMETCYKVFRRKTIQSIKIKENRFGFEP